MSLRAIYAFLLFSTLVPAQPTLNVPSVAYPTIQFAINVAANGSIIQVAPGTYTETINYSGKAVTVRGTGGAAVTTLLGNFGSRLVTFASGEGSGSVLDGFTLRNGAGGILIENASPVIVNCVLTNNMATGITGSGGGIRILGTIGTLSLTISNCSFYNNQASQSGGGLYLRVTSPAMSVLILSGCTFTTNYALGTSNSGGGGAIHAVHSGSPPFASSLVLIACTINDNFAQVDGGGILATSIGSFQATGCRIANNVCSPVQGPPARGGGIASYGPQVTLLDSLVVGNVATNGGGVFCQNSSDPLVVSIRNCTIAENRSAEAGGGVYYSWSGVGSLVATAVNCIFADNHPLDVLHNFGVTLTASYSLIGNGPFLAGPGMITGDPRFADPENDDFHLLASSPCRDAGQPGTVGLSLTDLDGTPRIAGAAVDIGADEIPAQARPGTGSDLDLLMWINGGGDPVASTRTAVAGQVLTLEFVSRGITLTGAPPALVAQVFPTAMTPGGTPGFPGVQIDFLRPLAVIYGSLTPLPFPNPGLPLGGVFGATLIPPGLSGTTLRLQGFVFTAQSPLGYASTHALEMAIP